MGGFSSRDIRSLVTSYISATSPSNNAVDFVEMLKGVKEMVQNEVDPKIILLLTNGNTDSQDELDLIVQELHQMNVQLIPIALSRKCRFVFKMNTSVSTKQN